MAPGGLDFYDRDSGTSKWRSESIGGSTVGYIDMSSSRGLYRDFWGAYNDAESITVEVWARVKSYRSFNTGIVSSFTTCGKHNWMWTEGEQFHMNGMRGSTYLAGNYNLNEWTRFVLVGQAGQGYYFWVNDGIVGSMSFGGDLRCGTSGDKIAIGARDDGVEPANADFSIVRIYNRALTHEELEGNWFFDKAKFGK